MARPRIENDLMFVRQGTFVEEMIGWQDFNDLATQTTPVTLTLADTWYTVPNDGLGDFTRTDYKVLGKPDIWNPDTDSFNFTELFVGGLHIIRATVRIETPSANTEVLMRMRLGIGSPTEVTVPVFQRFLKKNNVPYQISDTTFFTIGSENTRDFPAQLEIQADVGGCELTIEGWRIMTVDRF